MCWDWYLWYINWSVGYWLGIYIYLYMGTILIRDSHGQRCTAWTILHRLDYLKLEYTHPKKKKKLEYKSSLSIKFCLLYSCLEHYHHLSQMCQMPNIWHTNHKNHPSSTLPNLKKFETWLQYHLKYEMVRTSIPNTVWLI